MPRFRVKADLHTLHCITPTDVGGEDEPFVWTFFIRADGTTLQPDPNTPGRFIPALTVVAKPGAHGNLNVEGVVSGSNFKIPNAVGDFETELLPIPFTFTFAGQTFRGWIPGRLVCLAGVLDEDATSDSIANEIHREVVQRVQLRVNQFFGGLNFAETIANAAPNGIAAVRAAVNNFLNVQIATFRQQIRSELEDLALEVAIAEIIRSHNPVSMLFNAVVNALDHDELVGVGEVTFAEDGLIDAGLFTNATDNIRQSNSPLGGAWYVLHTSAHGELNFFPGDVVAIPSTGTVTTRIPGRYYPTRDMICVPPGQIEYWDALVPQSHDIMVTYPFCTYRYSIGGQVLSNQPGEIRFPAEVSIEEFNEAGYPFVKLRHDIRTVTVRYRQQPDATRPQLQHLILDNDPADGSYYFTLKIEAVLTGGRLLDVAEKTLLFEGQEMQFPTGFIERIEHCLEPFTSNKYAKSKRIDLRDLWGPRGHARRFEEVMQLIEERASIHAIPPERIESVRAAVTRAFNR